MQWGPGPVGKWRGLAEASKDSLRAWLPPLVVLAIFALALEVLRVELRDVRYHALSAAFFALPASSVSLALLLTALNYGVLTGYDQLAFAWLGRSPGRARVALAGFVAYAISNSLGLGVLPGGSVRYRFYTRWGVSAADLASVVVFHSTTFWLGLLLLGGLSLLVRPLPGLPGHGWVRAAGAVVLLLALAYTLLPALRRRPLRIGRLEVPVPALGIVGLQFLLSVLDWALAAAVLFVLVRPGRLGFGSFLGAYLAAQILGLLSHVPGGLGVFETSLVLLTRPALAAADLAPALLLYRILYYLLPLGLALAVLAADELGQRREQAARLGAAFGGLAEGIAPRLLAGVTFLGGAVLLFSGATPAVPGRLAWVSAFLPLPVLETSHFLGSVAGVGLLLLSWGIARRLDTSFYAAAGLLSLGVVTSLLKGADFEEATLMALLLLALVPARRRFDRHGAFFATRFSPGWVAAVVAVVGATVWLGVFSFKHVEYSSDLWWQFELERQASRTLRAGVGVAMALLAFGTTRLLRPAPLERPTPTDADLDDAARVVASQEATLPYLVFLRDKSLLFDEGRAAFLMYGVQRRTWVALGDPVGPEPARRRLIRAFLERADDYGAAVVFYQVTKEHLHHYADFGLTFVKLGEEARVLLPELSLEGGRGKPFRKVLHRLEGDGGTFRLVPAEGVDEILDELRTVSDAWLATKGAAEKGFSLGFFDREYLQRFPVALVEHGGRIVAFASVWPGPRREELSVDLMRFRAPAPRDVMEALLLRLMLWGKEQGFRFFNLGMAPLSGIEVSPVAPLWARMGSFVYWRGEPFYNFQGLRAYKEKFHPQWEPRYLAHPGGLSLPRILADVAALIAGGYPGIFLA